MNRITESFLDNLGLISIGLIILLSILFVSIFPLWMEETHNDNLKLNYELVKHRSVNIFQDSYSLEYSISNKGSNTAENVYLIIQWSTLGNWDNTNEEYEIPQGNIGPNSTIYDNFTLKEIVHDEDPILKVDVVTKKSLYQNFLRE